MTLSPRTPNSLDEQVLLENLGGTHPLIPFLRFPKIDIKNFMQYIAQ